jgi:hypothetical protein
LTAGEIDVGSVAQVNGTSMTGSGTRLFSNGGFAMGTATTNIYYRGQSGDKIYLNGDIVATGNLQANSVTQITSASYTSGFTFNYSDGSTGAYSLQTPLQNYVSGTILNVFFTAIKVDSGAGDIEVIFNLRNAAGTLVDTFGGVSAGKRMVQTMGPRNDKVTATFTGSTTITAGTDYRVEALVYNSYGDSWTSRRLELIVLGAKR